MTSATQIGKGTQLMRFPYLSYYSERTEESDDVGGVGREWDFKAGRTG